jgi:hypothetical protein
MRGGLRRLRKLQIDSAVGVVYNHVILSSLKRFAHAERPPKWAFGIPGQGTTKENLGIADGRFSRDSVVATVAAIFS